MIEALDSLGVRYYVGGSVASSIHGVPRASIDADLIAELDAEHGAPLAARLSALFYLDEGRMRDAVERRLSFNVIHLATMFKIDVVVSKAGPSTSRPAGAPASKRSVSPPEAPKARVASPEDTLLAKLEWIAVAASPPSASGPTSWVCCESGPAARPRLPRGMGQGAGCRRPPERASRQAG